MSTRIFTEIAKIESFSIFNAEVFKVCLRLPENSRFSFTAGQYLHLLLDEQDKRPFSIASAPQALPIIELHIRQMPGNAFIEKVLNQLEQADSIGIEGPFGGSKISKPGKNPICFIVGGTGFAPVKAILENLMAETSDQKLHLFWGARTAEELYLNQLPQSWQQDNSAFNYIPVIFEPDSSWQGTTGLVHKAAMEQLADSLLDHEIYIAGSVQMVLAVYQDLLAAGVAKTQIHADMLDILREQGELD